MCTAPWQLRAVFTWTAHLDFEPRYAVSAIPDQNHLYMTSGYILLSIYNKKSGGLSLFLSLVYTLDIKKIR